MIYKSACPPGTRLTEQTYSFLKPAVLTIRRKDGLVTKVGYGIGEQITVMEPSVVYLIAKHERLNEIPLADGGTIIEYPDDTSVSLVYK